MTNSLFNILLGENPKDYSLNRLSKEVKSTYQELTALKRAMRIDNNLYLYGKQNILPHRNSYMRSLRELRELNVHLSELESALFESGEEGQEILNKIRWERVKAIKREIQLRNA